MNKKGFTITELIISIGLIAVITGAVAYIFGSVLYSWQAAVNRVTARTQMAQTMEQMVRYLRQAKGIDEFNSGTWDASAVAPPQKILFTTDNGLGTGKLQPRFSLNEATHSLKIGFAPTDADGAGMTKVENVPNPATDIFVRNGNLVTIDITSAVNGMSIEMRTKVKLRM